jgi:hypothetical protein
MHSNRPNDEQKELAQRKRWFEGYCETLDDKSVIKTRKSKGRYACPCCKYFTLLERGSFEICSVCFWEDDGQDEHDVNLVRGGPNGTLSLAQARENYLKIGACDEGSKKHVRPPTAEELNEDSH